VVCTSLSNCDLSGERIIYAPEEVTTIVKKVQSQEQTKVERPDKKITHTTLKEELSRIQKRSASREQYILEHFQDDSDASQPKRKRKIIPIIRKNSPQDSKETPLQSQASDTKVSEVNELDADAILRATPPDDIPSRLVDDQNSHSSSLESLEEEANRLIEEVDRLEEEAERAEQETETVEDKAEDTKEHTNTVSHFAISEVHSKVDYDQHANPKQSDKEIKDKVTNLLQDKKKFFAYGRVGGYVHKTLKAAREACKDAGYSDLCSKEDVIFSAKLDAEQEFIRQPACYSGWTSGGQVGWYQVNHDMSCGGPNKWMVWKPTSPGAHCCGLPDLAERLKTWFQAGCTEGGLLFPDTRTQGTWMSMTDPDRAIAEIATRAQAGDRISAASCYGMEEVKQTDLVETAEDITFHMLWECYGDKKDACVIPDAHRLCLVTLRHLHPRADVIIWSKSLDPAKFKTQFEGLDFQLKSYGMDLFEGLPQRAQDAARDIASYFTKHENSFSHWSDLFRSSVLFKFGGIYADLDNIWFRPIERVISSSQWIPATQIWERPDYQLIERQGTEYYLEGGIMRMDKESEFLFQVLDNFPIYNQAAAECWNCVGPRHLTETWARLNEEDSFSSDKMPELVDSQLIYGVRDYRNEFKNMFREFDKRIWFGLDSFGCAGAHLFSSSATGEMTDRSLVAQLFSIAGVKLTTHTDINWRPSHES